jgi:hypothetical protein
MSTLSFRRQPNQACARLLFESNEQDRTEQYGIRYEIVNENIIETMFMNGKWELGDIIPNSHE